MSDRVLATILRAVSRSASAALLSVGVGVGVLGLPGCERASSTEETAVEPTPLESWSWSRFELGERVVLSEASARVAAQRLAGFVAPIDGPIEIEEAVRAAGAGGIDLASGEAWGRVAPERIDLERRAVAAQRRQLELRGMLFEVLDQPRSRLEAFRELDNAKRTRDQLRLAIESQDDPLVREVFPDLPAGFGEDVLAAAERLVEVLEENLRIIDDPEASVERVQLELAEVELTQAELNLDRLEERSNLVMPFDGELVLRPEYDTVGPLFVRSGDVIATARGGEVVLHVEAGEAAWLDVPSDRLVYVGDVPGGGSARSRFDRRETVEVRGQQSLIDRFVVEEGDGARALRRLTGASVRGRLIAELPEPARLVPKLNLLIAAPDAFARGDWSGGVARTWPGARVVGVGLTRVAIVPPVDGASP